MPEHERVATLQPHHRAPAFTQGHQQIVDFVLHQFVLGHLLAGIDAGGGGGDQVHDFRADQTVEHHHLGLTQQPERLDRQQIGVARSGPHQIDLAQTHLALLPALYGFFFIMRL
jgi:hypothetical protein